MDYVHEQTMKTFIKKELIDGLEIIIERNHKKLEKFLELSVRGRNVNNDIINRVKISSRTRSAKGQLFAHVVLSSWRSEVFFVVVVIS